MESQVTPRASGLEREQLVGVKFHEISEDKGNLWDARDTAESPGQVQIIQMTLHKNLQLILIALHPLENQLLELTAARHYTLLAARSGRCSCSSSSS